MGVCLEDRLDRPLVAGWRQRLYDIIFEADTPAGKTFDIVLLLVIMGSVVAVCLESVRAVDEQYGRALYIAEWVFTGIFSLEYIARMLCTRRPVRYATSFFGIVVIEFVADLAGFVVPVEHVESLLVVRALRLLRIFRVLKMGRYLPKRACSKARAARRKIIVFTRC